ncbi:endo alpha-1,4 polygalactosaminidase [Leucobacter tardus]|uniref:Endo alpha-1,4 polygalactosaminidase n=1 Tax=Leucobacter tardus TaxID=501483 RepID=A0A939QI74_9MICO|nr:endo alpha-1,4 polygalactosaminidase [Leucobacter tardus]MBO2990533.1 endo alpha-1,4 polygalactosaminidase [Leucobacter tardus]
MTACAPGSESGEPSPEITAGAAAEFPAGAAFDYQLGAAYALPDGVTVVTRDRTAEPASDAYSICYLNGFQTQPGEMHAWPEDAILRIDGEVRTDPDWPDEALLDIATEAGRTIVIDRVSTWIEGCRDDGFAAVEFDNLDTFTRSDGAISRDDAAIVATALVAAAHDAGLAAGQKNAAEHAAWLRDEAGFDFAVSEECAAFDECGTYTDVYGDAVMDIEYTDALPRPFAEVCGDGATPRATILRDRALVAPEDPDYVFEVC